MTNLEKLTIAANQFYLNKYIDKAAPISDLEYDQLAEWFESTNPGSSVKDLVEWESDLTFKNSDTSGFSKYAVIDNNLANEAKYYLGDECITNYYINLKYDGSSIVAYYDNGRLKMILGTPDESYGIIRTKAFWNLFPHKLADESIKSLRGEVLTDPNVYGQLARNKANGLTNSKLMDDDVEREAFIRIYRVDFIDSNEFDYNRSKEALNNLPIIKTTRNRKITDETTADVTDIVFSKASEFDLANVPNEPIATIETGEGLPVDKFQCDGIVIYSEGKIQALKFYYTESKITTVESISWNLKSNGSYAPVLDITPVYLNDKLISKVSANGVPNLLAMKMGVGASVQVILANTTIPKIINVIEPSVNYDYPKCSCGYQLSENDIYGSVLKCSNEHACSTKFDLWYDEDSVTEVLAKYDNFDQFFINEIPYITSLLNIDRFGSIDGNNIILSNKLALSALVKLDELDFFKEYLLEFLPMSDLSTSIYFINVSTVFEILKRINNKFNNK